MVACNLIYVYHKVQALSDTGSTIGPIGPIDDKQILIQQFQTNIYQLYISPN